MANALHPTLGYHFLDPCAPEAGADSEGSVIDVGDDSLEDPSSLSNSPRSGNLSEKSWNDVTIVDRPVGTKPVRRRFEKGRVSNGMVYVKVIPEANRSYATWSQTHLRLAMCARGIPGFSKSKDTTEMANILTAQDTRMKRSSPHIVGDFKVAGMRSLKVVWTFRGALLLA